MQFLCFNFKNLFVTTKGLKHIKDIYNKKIEADLAFNL